MTINNKQIDFFMDAYEIITRDGGRYFCNGKSYTDPTGKYHMGSVTEYKLIFQEEIKTKKPPFNKQLTEGCGGCIRDSVNITIEKLIENKIITREMLNEHVRKNRSRLH